MNDKVIKINQLDNYRIIAISDIHAHLSLLESLLDRLILDKDDYLIILGDFINRGPDNLATLEYIMTLAKRPRTIILKGNHEYFICRNVFIEGRMERFFSFLKEHRFHTIVHEMIDQLGYCIDQITDTKALSEVLLTHYREAFDFMNNLPVIAFFDDNIFVHGGYDSTIDIDNNEYELLKFDNYNHLGKRNDARVIVGHWPTANLRKNRHSNAPYFNNDKNIISIDGGVGINSSGELNALTINKIDGVSTVDYVQENAFIKTPIKVAHQFDIEEKTFINFPHFDIDVIKKGDTFSLCRHHQSGNLLSIFNSLLEEVQGKPEIKIIYINHFLNLNVGDSVEVCMSYDDCVLVKHNGEFGWILKSQI